MNEVSLNKIAIVVELISVLVIIASRKSINLYSYVYLNKKN